MGWLIDQEHRRRAMKASLDRLQKQFDDEQKAAERTRYLMGLQPPAPEPVPVQVGWMQRHSDHPMGVNHLCIVCQPRRPGRGHWEPVTKDRAAATRPCTKCQRFLEQVVAC